jgi:arylsulfatase A-like enzyme
MRVKLILALTFISSIVTLFMVQAEAENNPKLDRTVLPIPEPTYPPSTTLDVRNAKPPKRFEVNAPEGAPNVLIILIDDMGFGQSSTFGGPIHMATFDSLANNGLRYNQFHTTALCSPTRMALLTGRNHHMTNTGAIMELGTAFPGNTGVRPNSVATLPEILQMNGYATAAFGKYHETPPWELSISGPFQRWPTQSGFDKFYGFIGGETNQWSPLLYDGVTQIETPHDPNYHFMTDMTNQAINWIKAEKSLTPNKPFFIYFAPGATHAPHHVPKEWIAKYKGQFDMGWDVLREQTLARQKKLGIVPENTVLAPKPATIKDWDKLSPDEKKLFARQMEVFAGFGEYADTEIGRLIQAIKDTGQLNNTLIIYIDGDNGASAEGGANGLFNEITYFNGVSENVHDILQHIDDLGGPNSYSHYAAGWAVAGDTPFTWTKQVAGSYGGTRNGMVISWPNGSKDKNQIRSQWHHVIDITPTVLEAAQLPQPTQVNGTKQVPIQGVSMVYTFNDPKAQDKHTTQYFEIFGNRAIYHDGWLAGTVHKAPWEAKPRAALDADKWELYDTTHDFSLANDLAAKNPAKLKEMQALFLQQAIQNHVLPIDDRGIERLNSEIAGRPNLMGSRTSLTVYEGMKAMAEDTFINIKNRSFTITANVKLPGADTDGVILAQGGKFGGWSFYFKNGKPVFSYNWLGLNQYTIASTEAVPAGKAIILFQFDYDGSGIGKGGLGKIFVDGKQVAEGRINKTQAMMFSVDDFTDVGMDEGTPVTEQYGIPFPYKFTGKINDVTINVKPSNISVDEQKIIDQKKDDGDNAIE